MAGQNGIARKGTIGDLVLDPDNLNQGTERGSGILHYSLEQYGLGRGIVADRNGKVIGGNHITEVAAALGFDEVVFVPHDGKTLVVSQRTDLDLDEDSDAQAMAIIDNQSAAANLNWRAGDLLNRASSELLTRLFTGGEIERLAKSARPALTLLTDEGAMPTQDDAPAAPQALQARLPLAILLTVEQVKRWQQFKLSVGAKNDTDALMILLDAAAPVESGDDGDDELFSDDTADESDES